MATQNESIRHEWVDVKASLSLVDDQKYTFQNVGSFPMRIAEASSTPATNMPAIRLEPYEMVSVTPTVTGGNVYAALVSSVPLEGKTILVVTEAV